MLHIELWIDFKYLLRDMGSLISNKSISVLFITLDIILGTFKALK